MLDPTDDGALQVGFRKAFLLPEAKEFQDKRLLEDILRLADDLAMAGQLLDPFLVPAQGQTLVKAAVELALEFPDAPVLVRCLDLVKSAFIGVADAGKEYIVGPAQDKRAAGRIPSL